MRLTLSRYNAIVDETGQYGGGGFDRTSDPAGWLTQKLNDCSQCAYRFSPQNSNCLMNVLTPYTFPVWNLEPPNRFHSLELQQPNQPFKFPVWPLQTPTEFHSIELDMNPWYDELAQVLLSYLLPSNVNISATQILLCHGAQASIQFSQHSLISSSSGLKISSASCSFRPRTWR